MEHLGMTPPVDKYGTLSPTPMKALRTFYGNKFWPIFMKKGHDHGDFEKCSCHSLMEGNPHSVLEGMIIGAFAIGTPGKPEGFIYVRNEYPLAVERLTRGERMRNLIEEYKEEYGEEK
jgi:NADH:ubiquinone oxidoreductase subunit F (NADH-binding)